ncbi:dCTP deaminase [candidate division KSB1 bacterium]|nr:dCTP deaminase [candidate division KSB1 bacterium]
MILSDKAIREYLETGELEINPLDDIQIQPASLDLRLGNHFLKMADTGITELDVAIKPIYEEIEQEEIIVPAKSYRVVTSQEYIKLPDDVAAFVQGRSSTARMGLFMQNSGWVDPGFEGAITVSLFNGNDVPLKLHAGVRFCQLVFAKLDQAAANPYRGKYQGQRHATGSRVSMDHDMKKK